MGSLGISSRKLSKSPAARKDASERDLRSEVAVRDHLTAEQVGV